eukprot:3774003-Pleurochrysis_carterae.AAC.3
MARERTAARKRRSDEKCHETGLQTWAGNGTDGRQQLSEAFGGWRRECEHVEREMSGGGRA